MILTRSFYLNKIRDYYDVSKIKLLIGVRGCGKTTIIQSIMNDLLNNNVPKNQIIYLNFENIYFNNKPTNYNIKHLQKYPADKTKRIYLFIDEIYVINNYEEVINDLLVNYPNLSLFISSSNQNILNNNSINLIKDNIIIFNIMPFSYQEYLEYYKVNNLSLPDNPIDDFLKYGGMPSRFEKRINIESEIKEYSMNLYMNIVDKSICDFNLNIDKSNFLILSKFIFTHATKDFSTLKIMNEYNQYGDNKIFREHIYRCVNKLSDACMISRVKRYEYSTKKYLKSIERQYIVDNIVDAPIDSSTHQIVNTKIVNITFYLHSSTAKTIYENDVMDEIKYYQSVIVPYLTQMIPSTVILTVDFQLNRNIGGSSTECDITNVKITH